MKSQRTHRVFSYGEGVRIAGTDITCDARGFPSDLVFLSHANALAPAGPGSLAGGRAGRRQIVTTETTLRLLDEAGASLRARALPAAFGRPFNLGPHRLEVVPSGLLPGAAALLCETDTARAFYLGAFCPEPLLDGMEPALFRSATAVCINATAAHPDWVFPPRRQVLQRVRAFVEEGLRTGVRVVLFGSAFEAFPALLGELARAGIAVRAHQRIAAVCRRLRGACESLPPVARFSGKLDANEVLLWPPEARKSTSLIALGAIRGALVAATAADPAMPATLGIEHGFALSNLPTFAELLAAVEATASREVALVRGPAEVVAAALRQRGLDAYPLGPPRQMSLRSTSES
jgi:putative mRNA 3-end processing factor